MTVRALEDCLRIDAVGSDSYFGPYRTKQPEDVSTANSQSAVATTKGNPLFPWQQVPHDFGQGSRRGRCVAAGRAANNGRSKHLHLHVAYRGGKSQWQPYRAQIDELPQIDIEASREDLTDTENVHVYEVLGVELSKGRCGHIPSATAAAGTANLPIRFTSSAWRFPGHRWPDGLISGWCQR